MVDVGDVKSPVSPSKAAQQRYTMEKDRADVAKKAAEAKDLAFMDGKGSAVDKISEQKRRAGKAKNSVEQRQNEFAKAQELVKSLVEKIEKGTGGGN